MMDSDVLHVEEGKTNVLLTLDSTFCSFDCFVKTNERVIVAIGNRDIAAECMLTRHKLQCCSLGRFPILLCKFRESDAGLCIITCCIGQWLDMVCVFWRAEPRHNDCNKKCYCVHIRLHRH